MSWHVRYYSPELKTELQSLEFATEDEALAAAYDLAQGGGRITAIEGPDGEIANADEVEVWFRERGLASPPVRPSQP